MYAPFNLQCNFQMLTGEWKPDWNVFLQIPVGLNIERVWGHVSLRWEFKDVNAKDLSSHDREMVLQLVSTLKPS